jgi:hypothetical protein
VLTFKVALRRRLKPDLVAPSLHCIQRNFPLCITTKMAECYGQKKVPSHSLAIIQVDCLKSQVQDELFAFIVLKTLL